MSEESRERCGSAFVLSSGSSPQNSLEAANETVI